jgi:hypothetical protein
MSSLEFDRDAGKAQQLAEKEPVFIIDRGKASHVLLSIDQYRKLAGHGGNLVDRLAMDDGVDPSAAGDIDFRPVEFD